MALTAVPQDQVDAGYFGPQRDVVIDSAAALAAFKARIATPKRLGGGRIIVEPSLVPALNPALERRLNELYSDCGCSAGAAAAALAAVTSSIRLLRSNGPLGVSAGLRSLAAVSTAALAGKFAGLVYNRIVLLRLVASLEEQVMRREEAK